MYIILNSFCAKFSNLKLLIREQGNHSQLPIQFPINNLHYQSTLKLAFIFQVTTTLSLQPPSSSQIALFLCHPLSLDNDSSRQIFLCFQITPISRRHPYLWVNKQYLKNIYRNYTPPPFAGKYVFLFFLFFFFCKIGWSSEIFLTFFRLKQWGI